MKTSAARAFRESRPHRSRQDQRSRLQEWFGYPRKHDLRAFSHSLGRVSTKRLTVPGAVPPSASVWARIALNAFTTGRPSCSLDHRLSGFPSSTDAMSPSRIGSSLTCRSRPHRAMHGQKHRRSRESVSGQSTTLLRAVPESMRAARPMLRRGRCSRAAAPRSHRRSAPTAAS